MSFVGANIHFYVGDYRTKILGCSIFDNKIHCQGYWVSDNIYVYRIPNNETLWKVVYFHDNNIVTINKYYSLDTPSLDKIRCIINKDNEVCKDTNVRNDCDIGEDIRQDINVCNVYEDNNVSDVSEDSDVCEDTGVWEGTLPYIISECNINLEKINVINSEDLYTIPPSSWSVKSLLSADPSTIEEFKECANFSIANTKWLIAEEKRLAAVLRLRRKKIEVMADSLPITGKYTTRVKEILKRAIECDAKLNEAQYKLNEIHSNCNNYEKGQENQDLILYEDKCHLSTQPFNQRYLQYFETCEFITINIHKMTFCGCLLYFIGFFFCAGLNTVNKLFNKKC